MKRLGISLMIGTAMLLSSGCGQRADLEPRAGVSLPQEPYGTTTAPEAAQLLELETQAVPERSVELRRRSEEREDDPFDLPPE